MGGAMGLNFGYAAISPSGKANPENADTHAEWHRDRFQE